MCDDVPLPERVQKTYWSIRVENYPGALSVEVTSGRYLIHLGYDQVGTKFSDSFFGPLAAYRFQQIRLV